MEAMVDMAMEVMVAMDTEDTMERDQLMLMLSQVMAMVVMDMVDMEVTEVMEDMDTEDTMEKDLLMLKLMLSQDTLDMEAMVVMDMVDMEVTEVMEDMDT